MSESPVVIVLTTLGASADATAIARALVDEHLAACVNILPAMTSIYRWQGRVEEDREQQLVLKTREDALPQLEARLRALHPYDLPEFLVMRTSGGSGEYLNWVRSNTRAGDSPI